MCDPNERVPLVHASPGPRVATRRRGRGSRGTQPKDFAKGPRIWCPATWRVEQNLHSLFADRRFRGEWFRLSDQDISFLCDRLGFARKTLGELPW